MYQILYIDFESDFIHRFRIRYCRALIWKFEKCIKNAYVSKACQNVHGRGAAAGTHEAMLRRGGLVTLGIDP